VFRGDCGVFRGVSTVFIDSYRVFMTLNIRTILRIDICKTST